MPDYSNAYVPSSGNLRESVMGGIKTGQQWAAMKMNNDYRRAEMQRQQQQLDIQRADHLTKVTDQSFQNWTDVSQSKPGSAIRKLYTSKAQQFDSINGIDPNAMAAISKDPNFYVDTLKPLGDYLQGIKSGNPQQIIQGLQGYKQNLGDPKGIDSLLQIAARSGSQEYKQSQGIQQRVQGQQDVAQFKHDLGPTDAAQAKQGTALQQHFQDKLNADPGYKNLKSFADFDTIRSDLENAKDSPEAANSAGIKLGRMLNDNQRTPVLETQILQKGDQSLIGRLKQAVTTGTTGTLTQSNVDDMKKLVDNFEQGATQKKFEIENHYAGQYVQDAKKSGTPVDRNAAYEAITGNPYPKGEEAPTQKSAFDSVPADQKGKLSQWIQQHQAAGTDSDTMKKQLSQRYGSDFSDDDLRAAGSFANPSAAPAQTTPNLPPAASAAATPAPAPSTPAPAPIMPPPDQLQGGQ